MPRRYGLSLNQLVFAVAALLALCGFVGLLAFELKQSYGREFDFAERDVETLSRVLERQASSTIEKIDVVLRDVVADFAGRQGDRRLAAAVVNARLKLRLDSIPESQSLRVANADGRFIYDATGEPGSVSISDRAYFQRHRNDAGTGLVISEPIFARLTANWVITVSRRLNHLDGSFAGVVQAAVRADYFRELYKTLDVGKDGLIGLYDDDLRLIARHPERPDLRGKRIDAAQMETFMSDGARTGVHVSVSPLDGIKRTQAFRRLGDLPLVIVVGKSHDDFLGVWRQKALIYALAAVICALLLGVLTLVWQRSYGRAVRMAGEMSSAYERAMQQARALLDSLPDPAWLRDRDGRHVAVNQAFLLMCGLPMEKVVGKTGFEIWREPEAGYFHRRDQEVLDGQRQIDDEGSLQGADGRRRYYEYVRTPVRDERGEMVGIAGFARDVTERKEAEDRIRHLAEHDALTDLPNRMLLSERMSNAIACSVGEEMRMALLFIDLDHFKNVNDTLGHNFGDSLLQEVATRLRETVYGKDMISRQGGDEFSVLLVDCANVSMIAVIAQRVIDAVGRPFLIDGHELNLTASVGISVYPHDGAEIATLLKHADAAMYCAKASGRNAYRFFKPEMNARIAERMQLDSSLRKALQRQEFQLAYQPQYATESGAMVGVEALLRWRHPEQGMISPARFIPVAEDTGMILPIGEWVLHEACRQNVAWQRAGLAPFVMAVNLSALQFQTRKLVGTVRAALANSGLAPEFLELEITESVLMNDTERMLGMLEELRALGVKLSIDDFGTGYSSLNYLKRFPIDKIKIDQSFVRDVTSDADDAAIIQAIIAIAAKLGLKSIAEGVETAEQYEFLRLCGCDEIQGYYFSRPVPAEAIPDAVLAAIPG